MQLIVILLSGKRVRRRKGVQGDQVLEKVNGRVLNMHRMVNNNLYLVFLSFHCWYKFLCKLYFAFQTITSIVYKHLNFGPINLFL
jgi:hypothetical protein